MDIHAFGHLHLPALESDEIRFNVQIAVLTAALSGSPSGFSYWTLGSPGHCAMQSSGRAILLGILKRDECRELARATIEHDYPAVMGPSESAALFAAYASELGVQFAQPIPQRIHVLSNPPKYPSSSGSARDVTPADAPLLFQWLTAFQREAVPHDSVPKRADVEMSAASGRFLFWTQDGRAVSVAAIARRLRHTAAIAPVYTPPETRGHGYAGSATATLVDRLLAEGKSAVCLFTDLRNAMSNRCYAKIGFRPYCDYALYLRATQA
jgi:predicted GNAT family acetyltransferase